MEPSAWKQQWKLRITLIAVVTLSFMSCLDASIVNVALPVISKDLSEPLSTVEWVITGYLIMICASLLFFGRLGDLLGKSRVFLFGTIVFTAGSLLCGISGNITFLILSRLIQGIGAAAYMANNQGIITQLYPASSRGRALGVLASAVALGNMAGPALGGLLVGWFGWSSIFFVNVPIGIAALAICLRVLPKERKAAGRMDGKGAALMAAWTVCLFYALTQGQKSGFAHPLLIVLLLLAALTFVLFLWQEIWAAEPMIRLRLFRNRWFSISLFCAFVSYVCIGASTILLPFYLEDTQKYTAAGAGLFFMLSPLIVTVVSPVAGLLTDRIGPKVPSMFGLACMAVGFWMLAGLQAHSVFGAVAFSMGVMSLGQGFFQPPNNTLVMSAASRDMLGAVGSINAFVRNLGQIVGVTVSTTFLYLFMSWKTGTHVTDYPKGRDAVFLFGMHGVYLILVVICVCGVAMTVTRFLHHASGQTE